MANYRPGKCHLHNILRENKLSMTKLSFLSGISLNQLSDYANNHRVSMSLSNAISIAFALGVPVEELYEWVNN